ncbi:MAG: hypothetical protein ACRDJM_09095 [Actinomycetota bacterium]
MTRKLAILAALAALLAACGKAGSTPPPGDTGRVEGPILRMEYVGGFVPVEYQLSALPTFLLTGEGKVYAPGSQIEIYPPPALPSIQEKPVTADAVRRIREEAERAGLTGPDKTYRHGAIADAPNTRFVYVDPAGTTHTIEAEALGIGEEEGGPPPPGASQEDLAARRKLAEFARKLGDLQSWLPKDSTGEDRQYEFDALRIFSKPYEKSDGDGQSQPEKAWPLSTPLSSFGTVYNAESSTRCGVVRGEDLSALKPSIAQSNSRTPWRSGDKAYQLVLRPLLPGESGCPARPSYLRRS